MGSAASDRERMTFEEAAKLDPDRQPGELDAGRWVPVTRNTWRHGEIIVNVCALLRAWARSQEGFRISAGDPGAKLQHDPDVLRGPDVAVVRTERVPQGRGADGWLDGAPDLAVEVIGDARSASDVASKALEYLEAGGQLVWVIDPEPRRVMVYTPPQRIQVLGPDAQLDGNDVLPGFRCLVSEFFE